MDCLSSLTNPKIKYLIKLRDNVKFRLRENKFFIQGSHIVQEALKAQNVHEIFVTKNVAITFDLTNVSTTIISNEIANKIASTPTNQGIFAICNYTNNELDFDKNTLVLDAVQDPGNMGTLIRSAAAFGFKNIIASNDCVSFFNEKVLRSTQGMIFGLNLMNCILSDQLLLFKKNDYKIVGTFLKNKSICLQDISNLHNSRVCLIVGNEGNGISNNLINLIDLNLKIEMDNNVESLNVAVAGSLIMYHLSFKN